MSGMSRRALLQASAGAAALAAVPISALSSGAAAAAAGRATTPSPDDEATGLSLGAAGAPAGGPVMFCVHDAARGEVAVLQGGHEVIVRDRQLVARVTQAAARHSV